MPSLALSVQERLLNSRPSVTELLMVLLCYKATKFLHRRVVSTQEVEIVIWNVAHDLAQLWSRHSLQANEVIPP